MPLDDLVEVIETLQQRIHNHGDSLRQNEIRTRVALIDPLLTALGWDVADPSLVMAEYSVGGGRADYALRTAGSIPAATFEAKRLGEPLEPHRLQMLNYSNAAGIRYAGLTDGNSWELYEIFKQGTLEERRILEVSIVSDFAYQSSLKFLLLWRPNLATGRPVEADRPLVERGNSEAAVYKEVPESESLVDDLWTPLTELNNPQGTRPPVSLRLPSGEEKEISSWSMLFAEVGEWLVGTNKLTPNQCPVRFRHRKRYLVNTEALHYSGTRFKRSHKLSNGLYCEFNWKAEQLVDAVSFLLQNFGLDPAAVKVKVN